MTNYEILKLFKEGKISDSEAKKMLKENKSAFSNILYLHSIWKESGLAEKIKDEKTENIIVFCEEGKNVVFEGYNQINIFKGETFQKKSNNEYICDPYESSQIEKLWKEIGGRNNYIVYLWKIEELLKDGDILFTLFQTWMRQGAAKSYRIVAINDSDSIEFDALEGFSKSIMIENPNIKLHIVDVPVSADINQIARNELLYFNDSENAIKYQNGKRYAKEIDYINDPEEKNNSFSFENKTYLITGGAGGLGLIFADYLSAKGAKKIILTGRSEKNNVDEVFYKIRKRNTEIVYQRLDVCDKFAVKEFVDLMTSENTLIDGIIHSAGVLRDSYMLKKSWNDFKTVLEPKVEGLYALYEAFKDKKLDFFITFSSIVGVLGNAGQADYATANCFMDNFMHHISNENKNWKRAISINWPFWNNGGMKLSEDNLKYMEKKYGLYPISRKDGIEAFEYALSNNESQVVVINGDPSILGSYISCLKKSRNEVSENKQKKTAVSVSDVILKQKVVEFLKKIIADETKMPEERISVKVPIEKYGLDSVMMMNVSNELEKLFGPIRKTLLFEYITIDKLSDYFVENFRDTLVEKMVPEITETDKNIIAVDNEVVKIEPAPYKENVSEIQSDDIAIIGLAGKYPMADDLDTLWKNLCVGKDCITTVPEDRWDANENKSKWGGFINDVDKFDPLLFELSYKEAALLDPSERIFMENVWSALEDASYTKEKLSDKNVGVFVGAMYAQYQFYGVEDYRTENAKPLNSSLSSIANHISYFFDFHGPSLTIDTMCSSSLTALHFAVKCLKDGECDVAIVGGVNLSLHPYKYYVLEENHFTSSDGRCRSFGDGGDGYVPGEGCGTIIIKPLKKAIEDHDYIHAVIKGTAINHGGHVGGFTVPNPNMQAEAISKALHNANVEPSTIQYIEAHGTGTHLGDPIEIAGLEKAFNRNGTDKKCSIGSIKSNIGHLEGAAGIAGITKVILQMEHQKLVPSIHSEKLNSEINFAYSPFKVQRTLEQWNPIEVASGTYRRRAGVSSFGAGGSNSHVIMEDYKNLIFSMSLPCNVVVLSARTKSQLSKHIDRILYYVKQLKDTSDEIFTRFCYSLQQGREQLGYRLAVVCSNFRQFIEKIEQYHVVGSACSGVYSGSPDNTGNVDEFTDISDNTRVASSMYNGNNQAEIAEKWCNGMDLDWGFLYQNKKITPMSLPNLPFEKVSLWLPKRNKREEVFIRKLSKNDRIINDHVINGRNIVPTAYILEMFAAAAGMHNEKCICVKNMKIFQPVIVEYESINVKIVIKRSVNDGSSQIKLFSEDGSKIYSSCNISNSSHSNSEKSIFEISDSEITGRYDHNRCYDFFSERGYQYGKTLRLINSVKTSDDGVIAYIDENFESDEKITVPELLDAAFQTTMLFESDGSNDNYIPVSIDQITLNKNNFSKGYKITAKILDDVKYKIFDVEVSSAYNQNCVNIKGLKSIKTNEVSASYSKVKADSVKSNRKIDIGSLKQMLIKLIAEKLEMPADEITPQIGFEKIGINSISSAEIIAKLDEMYEGIPRTIFYETSNINELAEYIAENYQDDLITQDNHSKVSEYDVNNVHSTEDTDKDIAIIGVSGRYPMADNLDEFWKNLLNGKDCITTIPKERWDYEKYFDTNKDSELKHYSKWGGFINNIDKFDPLFYNIAPSQASMIDPQERLFLNTAWECMEDAGYTPEALSDHKVGVYVGAMWGLYHLMEVEKDGKKQIPQTTFSSIANRVSYVMNFDGPSIAVDTMCSSSITAIHLACEAIKSGEIQEAIAGGVNLSIHPSKYIQLCQGNFLSTDGRCRSFGEGGDGYVPGEGVGAVLLKSLSKAIEDNDNIYGVIKASSVNHGGHSNGYTVPNGKKQVEVLSDCISKANVDINDISYIEAHGTGTELGDPIEVNSLSKVFANRREKCPVGSVKSNIGHTEAAAGIAALTKVLLQFKYNKLVPSIHAEELNKNIDFKTAKVEVQRTLKDWTRPMNKKRIAAIDSFGAGGSNGCLIVEDYAANSKNDMKPSFSSEQILILSARESDRLEEYGNNLLKYFENDPVRSKNNWDSIIYTLQTGRKAFEYRLAIVCRDFEDAYEKLRNFIKNQKNDDVFVGYASEKVILKNKDSLLGYDPDIRKCAFNWANGGYVDWRKISSQSIRKISLPFYPFAQESYYADNLNAVISSDNSSEVCDKKIFDKLIKSTDSVISEHIIAEKRLLPGTFYIAFINDIFKDLYPDDRVEIYDINWKEPFELRPDENEKRIYAEIKNKDTIYEFEIFYNENNKRVICVTGKGRKNNSVITSVIDIDALKYDLKDQISDEDLYDSLIANDYHYGESYKRTFNISYNENEALADIVELEDELSLNRAAELLDACIRTALCINGNIISSQNALRIPFYLDSFNLYGDLDKACFAYSYSDNEVKEQKTQKCNVIIADKNGKILAFFENLTSRIFSSEPSKKMVLAHRIIKEEKYELPDNASLKNAVILKPDSVDISFKQFEAIEISQSVFDSYEELFKAISENLTENRAVNNFVFISGISEKTDKFDFELVKNEVKNLTNTLKALTELKMNAEICLVYCLLSENGSNPFAESVQSYFNSFTMINSGIKTSVAIIKGNEPDHIVNILSYDLENIDVNRKNYTIYEKDKKYLPVIDTFDIKKECLLLKENGVYLIAGGCGKLGRNLTKYISDKYHASFVLVGRSGMNDSIKDIISDIEVLGGNAIYLQCDICDIYQVTNVIKAAVEHYGCLNGIINMAGITSGKSILEATDEDIQKVLSGKIAGIENLDHASKDIELDFFTAFSSVSCIMGDFGECLYSMSNEYMNQFIKKRDSLVKAGKRTGQSIAIAWPLFSDGSFALPEDQKNIYFSYSGMSSLSNEDFTRIFDECTSSENTEVLVFFGDKKKIEKMLNVNKNDEFKKGKNYVMKEINNDKYYNAIAKYLKDKLCEYAGIPGNRIKDDDDFERYGIDSIMIMNMNKAIEKDFSGISKTLFFEYSNIHDMAEYFVNKHRSQLNDFFKIEEKDDVPEIRIERKSNFPPRLIEHTSPRTSKKIAIIGAAGRFPKADDLDGFWEILKNGMDCIEEINGERWSVENYYSEDKSEDGKIYCKWGGFINDADKFDPLFFNIAPSQAEKMDPQERIFLETSWAAIEDAGYTKETLKDNSVAVYVGAMYAHYQMLAEDEYLKGNKISVSSYLSSIANRVSYVMDFNGPSATVDTACSSALEAIRLGCLNIQNGDCDMALVGGVNLSLHPQKYIFLCQSNFLASDGRCHSYEDNGDGYVPGEGVGAILLKPLEDAERDNDHIYAVINSIAANHGGKTTGYTVPSPNAQSSVIDKAIKKAGIDPETISYIEGHGTGTILGDPIEVTGLTKAFRNHTQKNNFCALGSAKANIGHLESAAGIAGVIKILLQMKYRMIPPLAGSDELNPNINFAETPFYVPRELQEWKRPIIYKNGIKKEVPLRAGINAFGAGGSNVHIELEEYISHDVSSDKHEPCIIVLSAKNTERLKEYAKKIAMFVEKSKTEYIEECDGSSVDKELINKLYHLISDCLDIPCEVVEEVDDLIELGADQVSIEKIKNEIKLLFNADISDEFMKSSISIRSISEKLGIIKTNKVIREKYSIRLDELAYTLQVGREHMNCRIGFVANDMDDLIIKLERFADNDDRSDILFNVTDKNEDVLDLFTDEDGRDVIDIFIRKNRIEKLLSLWVKGINVDWRLLYQNKKIKKISLPTYPFERKRYYIDVTDNDVQLTKQPTSKIKEITKNEKEYTFESNWFLDTGSDTSDNSNWRNILICYHKSTEKFAELLGEYYKKSEVQYYEFGSDEFIVKTPLKKFDRVYFIGAVQNNEDPDEEKYLSNLQALFSLLKIAFRGNRPASICVCSNMAYYVLDNDDVDLCAGGTFGFLHSIEKEYTDISFSYFDLDVYKNGNAFDPEYVQRIIPVISRKEENVKEYAIRNGYIYSRNIYPVSLDDKKSELKENGNYVVFGGMGSVGRDLTKYLLEKYSANVIIIGRQKLDDKRKSILEGYENYPGKAYYYQSDICDISKLKETIASLIKEYKHLDGIFNSTMVFSEKSFSELKKEEFEEAVKTKVIGNSNILKAMEKYETGFIVAFSSVQAYNGNQGRVHYSTACDFADQYLRYAGRKYKCPVKIINWGFWGSYNGMPLQEEYVKELNEKGVFPLEPEYAMKTMEKVIANDFAQVLVFHSKQYVLDLMHILNEKPDDIYTNIMKYEFEQHYEFEPELQKEINELCGIGALKVLQSSGFFNGKNKSCEKDIIFNNDLKCGKYKQLLEAVIAIAVKAGYISVEGNELMSTKKIVSDSKKIKEFDQKVDNACKKYNELDGYLKILKHCVHEMPDVLDGKKSAEEVLFPDSKMDLVEGVYKTNKMSAYLNKMLAVGIKTYVERSIPKLEVGEKINILEIGSGTGSSSETVLEYISPYSEYVRYIYSDISTAFLLHGQKRFKEKYSFIDYKILNVENDLTKQGEKAKSIDIVFGTNVFHATKSIKNTLTNIREIMKNDGLFMLNEGTQTIDVLTLSFGMLTGWWLFEDEEIRIPHSPLLTSDNWIKELKKCGYDNFLNMESIICARTADPDISRSSEEFIKSDDKADRYEQMIIKILMDVLKLDFDEIEVDRKIMDYGVDSILVGKIIAEINEKCGIEVTPDEFFECETIENLVKFMSENK